MTTLHATDEHGRNVTLELGEGDCERVDEARNRETVGRLAIGEYVPVTDAETDERWEVASAPCGLGCHCAAVARRIID